MVFHCAHCRSTLLQAGLDELQCLACGQRTKSDGTAVAPDPVFDPPPSEHADRRYRPGDTVPS